MMVLLDGSSLAEKSLPFVEDMARRLKMDVSLVRAVNTDGLAGAYGYRLPAGDPRSLEVQMLAEASKYLDKVADRLRAKGFKANIKVLKGSPATTIAAHARQIPNDLIVLTTHGRSGVKRWVMGSVAESVIRSSGDPVMVVPNI